MFTPLADGAADRVTEATLGVPPESLFMPLGIPLVLEGEPALGFEPRTDGLQNRIPLFIPNKLQKHLPDTDPIQPKSTRFWGCDCLLWAFGCNRLPLSR